MILPPPTRSGSTPDSTRAPDAGKDTPAASGNASASVPSISLPKGGGAIRGIGEKFSANPVTGTGSLSIPVPVSPGRSGFGPQLTLSYDSGSGNSPFGFGWSLSLPAITRKTDKGLPLYQDAEDSDVFVLSGAEDLVPVLTQVGDRWTVKEELRGDHLVRFYRPRIEGLFARIERWTNTSTGEVHWRSITRDNVTTLYGKSVESRIADSSPSGFERTFSWSICESFDDKGNAIVYQYKRENADNVDLGQAHEANRTGSRGANLHLKRIMYGNRTSRLTAPEIPDTDWMFEVVLDYGEHDADKPLPGDDAPSGSVASTRSPPTVPASRCARTACASASSCFIIFLGRKTSAAIAWCGRWISPIGATRNADSLLPLS